MTDRVETRRVNRGHALTPIAVISVIAATAVGSRAVANSTHAASEQARIPLLAPAPALSIDSDLPTAVRMRLEREQRARFDRARAAARMPATVANGCVPNGTAQRSLGPPAPQTSRRILGHHVEVVFTFARLPRSGACRPWDLTVVTYNGRPGNSTYNNWVEHFRVRGKRGRVVVDLPWGGMPPYRVGVSSETILGRRSPLVMHRLRCPRTGDDVRGCLPGYRPELHAYPMPKPVLPMRGLDRTTLERSLRYVLADEKTPPILAAIPRSSRCPSLRSCVITYVDPAFPASPYRVRYRIAGEQITGCWMGLLQSALDPLPFSDARRGRLELAACASWLD
jgi:hypothetical protein